MCGRCSACTCVSDPHLHMLEDGLQSAVQLIRVLQFLPKVQKETENSEFVKQTVKIVGGREMFYS